MPDTVPVGTALLTYAVDNRAAIAAINANKTALRQLAAAQKRVESITLRTTGSAAALRQINGITSALERQLAVTQQLATAQAAVSRTVSRSAANQAQSAQEQARAQAATTRLSEQGRESLRREARERRGEGGRLISRAQAEQRLQQQQQQQARTFATEQQRDLQARQQAEQQLRQQRFAGLTSERQLQRQQQQQQQQERRQQQQQQQQSRRLVSEQQQTQSQQLQQSRASRRELTETARLSERQVDRQRRQNQQAERSVGISHRAAEAERRVTQSQQQRQRGQQQEQQQQQQSRIFATEQQRDLQARQQAEQRSRQQRFAGLTSERQLQRQQQQQRQQEQRQQRQQEQQSRTFASEQQQLQRQQQRQSQTSRRELTERTRLAERQIEQQRRQNQQAERGVGISNRAADAERRVTQLQQQRRQAERSTGTSNTESERRTATQLQRQRQQTQQQQRQQEQQSRTLASEQQRNLQDRQRAEQRLRQQQFAGIEAQQQIQQQQQQQGRASRRELAERARLAEQQVQQQQRLNQQAERGVGISNRAIEAERRVVQLQQQTSQQRVTRAEQREQQAERNVQTAQQRVQRESQNLQRIANEVTAQQPRNAEAQIRNAERRLETANRQLDRAEQRAQTARQQTQTAKLAQQSQEARAQRRLATIEGNQARQEERRSQRKQQQIDRETRSRARQRAEVERSHSQAINLLRREEAARERASRAQTRANFRAIRSTQANSRSTTHLIRQLTLASSTFTGLYAFGFEALADIFIAPFRALDAPVARAHRNIRILQDLTRETLIGGVAGAGRRVEAAYTRAGVVIDGTTAKILRNEAAIASASGRIGAFFAGTGVASVGLLGGLTLVGGLVAGGAVAFAAQFEREFTNVIKTVNSATTDIGELEQRLADLSQVTPGSVIGLSQIATIAGQLGIEGAANIARFVDTVARLEVSTDLNREDAAFQLARLANRFQTDQYERLASVIVALGNSLPTTERRILELATRFSASGRIAGLTADQILALSAAVSSVGIQSELGGTALQRIFLRLFESIARGGEELESFASIARLSGEEFRELFRESPRDAIQTLLRGIQDEVPDTVDAVRQAVDQGGQELQRLASIAQLTSDQFVAAFQVDPDSIFETLLEGAQANTANAFDQFRKLELGGQRLLLTILSLSGQQELLAKAFDTASEAARSQNDLFRESELFYNTLIEQLKQLGSNLRNNAIELGQVFLPLITNWLTTNNEILRRLQSARSLGIGRLEALRASPAEIRTIGDRLESAPLDIARLREQELRAELVRLSTSHDELARHAERSTGRRLRVYTNQIAEIETEITEVFTELQRVRERINRPPFDSQAPPPIEPESVQIDPAELERIQRELDDRRLAIVAHVQLRRDTLIEQFEAVRSDFESVLVVRPNLLDDVEDTVQRAASVGRTGNQAAIREAINEIEGLRERLSEIERQDSRRRAEVVQLQRRSEQQLLSRHEAVAARNAQRLQRFQALQSEFGEALETLGLEGQLFSSDELDRLAEILPRLQRQIELNEFAMRRLLNLGGNFFSELAAGGREGETVFSRLQRVANSFLQEILDLIIQTTVLRPLLENLLSAFPSIGQFIGGGQFGVPTDVTGNPAQSGGLRRGFTLVGEGGPEIVDFRSASRVYSNSSLRDLIGGSGSTIINFSPVIESTDGPGVTAALQQALPLFEQVVRSNLARDSNRPSSLRQQLRNA